MARPVLSRLRPVRLLAILAWLACAGGAHGAVDSPPRIPSPTKVIWSASGARSGSQLTTAAMCSNRGSVPGTIGAIFYAFNGTQVCTIAYGSVLPGETRTLAADPIASMSSGQICSGSHVLNQGRIELYVNTSETEKFDCTIMLIDTTNNPPVSMTRLTLYSGSGVFRSDVIFADGVDP
jgi:hypothetical protein